MFAITNTMVIVVDVNYPVMSIRLLMTRVSAKLLHNERKGIVCTCNNNNGSNYRTQDSGPAKEQRGGKTFQERTRLRTKERQNPSPAITSTSKAPAPRIY